MIKPFAFGAILGLAIVSIIMAIMSMPTRPYECSTAWNIVEQRGHTNFGFVTASGSICAGFTNKESAIEAMEATRYWHRHPKAQQEPESMWKVVQ